MPLFPTREVSIIGSFPARNNTREQENCRQNEVQIVVTKHWQRWAKLGKVRGVSRQEGVACKPSAVRHYARGAWRPVQGTLIFCVPPERKVSTPSLG